MKEHLARLQDPNPSVRGEAAWALGAMGTAAATPEVLGALIQRLRKDEDGGVRYEAAKALGKIGKAAATPEVIEALVQALRKDEDRDVRQKAAWALGKMGAAAATPEVLQALAERLLQDESGRVREEAAGALGRMGAAAATPEVIQALLERLREDEVWWVREEAAWDLGRMGEAAARPEVLEALTERLREDAAGDVRWAAAWALGKMGETAATPEVIEALVQALRDRVFDVRQKAAEALRQLLPAHPEALRNFLRVLPVPMTPQETQALEKVFRDSPGAVPAVRALLSDPDPKVRAGAIRALGAVGPAAATPEIVRDLLTRRLDEAPNVRTAALEVLRKLPVSSETVSAVLRDFRGDEPEAGEATAWALERLG